MTSIDVYDKKYDILYFLVRNLFKYAGSLFTGA